MHGINMNANGVPVRKNSRPGPQQNSGGLPPNGVVKNSIMDAMLLLVMSLCFVGVITFFIGLAILNTGLYESSIEEYVSSGTASTDIMKGLVNLIIGIALLFSSYGFVMYTIERKSWWYKLR